MMFSASQSLFSKQDMENMMDKVSTEIQTTVRQELEIFYRMAGIDSIVNTHRCVCANAHV